MAENEHHYCMCIAGKELSPDEQKMRASQKAALLKRTQWVAGALVTARFLEGDPELQARVKAVANEWTAPRMARLTFDFRNSGPTDIRIAFRQGKGSWSYLGTECRSVHEPEPTMNFGWLTPDSPDSVLRPVVLHEFGHALGLIHEHQNPAGGIKWNKDAVINDLSGPPNNWDAATIENNMFKPYASGEIFGTQVDAHSIMMYPIPKAWTCDGFSAGFNSELSQQDRNLIRQAYNR